MKIPLVDLKAQHKPLMAQINKSIKSIFESSSFIKGPILKDFEKSFAKFIGTNFAIGVASGTDALQLSLMALGISPGDEVIMPVNTFIATAYAPLYLGAKPVFVDINEKTYNIDTDKIEQKITKNTKVIIPVHLYGQPAQMDKILKIAKKYKLHVVEDCAQAHGALLNNKKVGTFGILSAWSFYTSKNLGACGDGGAVVTNSKKISEKLLRLRDFGRVSHNQHDVIGLNSRLDTIQAAILDIKLKHLDKWNIRRQQVANYYDKRFSLTKISGLITPLIDKNAKSVYYVYTIRCQKRDRLMAHLADFGIQTGIYYPIPLHLQKSLKHLEYKKGDFPVAEKVNSEILSLPMYPGLSKLQQDYIIKKIKYFYK